MLILVVLLPFVIQFEVEDELSTHLVVPLSLGVLGTEANLYMVLFCNVMISNRGVQLSQLAFTIAEVHRELVQ